MELDWTTVILEIINFIILMWLLKHFLYRPILNVVEQRQASVKATLEQAHASQQQAEVLQKQYGERLQTWEQEQQEARRMLQEELAREKNHQLEALRHRLKQEEEKAKTALDSQNLQWRRELTENTLQMSAEFASELLKPLADVHLEARLIELFCQRAGQWPEEKFAELGSGGNHALAASNGDSNGNEHLIQVSSAYPVPEALQQQLQTAIQGLLKEDRHLVFNQNPDLIAGIRITTEGWTFGLSLADELRGFAEAYHE